MTGPEFRAALVALGIEQQAFAARFGLLPGTVSRWVCGHRAVPSWVPPVLELLEHGSAPANVDGQPPTTPEAATVERVAHRLQSWLRPGLDARYVARAVLSVLAPSTDYHQLRRASKVMGDEDRE